MADASPELATATSSRLFRTITGCGQRGEVKEVGLGARESNAGDDFHVWWAASRALALVEPDAASQLVTIEGLGRVDDPEDGYEVVDVAEFVGGSDIGTAGSGRPLAVEVQHAQAEPGVARQPPRCTALSEVG